MSVEGRVSVPSFHRLAQVRAVHASRRRRRLVTFMLSLTLAAIVAASIRAVLWTSFEHPEPAHVEPAAAFPDPAEASTVVESAPSTVGPAPAIADTRAAGAERPAAERRAPNAAAGRRPKRHTVSTMATGETHQTTRTPAEPDADPGAVIEWLLQTSRPARR